MKRYKSLGIDEVLAELIQAGGNTLCSELHKLPTSVWNKEELLQQWKESYNFIYLIKRRKKWTSNCTGLSLFPVTKFYPIFL
jgi:hypothetical protein